MPIGNFGTRAPSMFPMFSAFGAVSPQVRELAVTFVAESVDALSKVPPKSILWANRGTRTTQGIHKVKVPITLPSNLDWSPFNGARSFQTIDIAAPEVTAVPLNLNAEWPLSWERGQAVMQDFVGGARLAQKWIGSAKAQKAVLVANVIKHGFTNVPLGVEAKALTIPQPGFPNGLPLFVDELDIANWHYSHPFKQTSGRFANLHTGVGKITDDGVFGRVQLDFMQTPHPLLSDMHLGRPLTDVVGPTSMMDPFFKLAVQSLSLETSGAAAAATTNRFKQELIRNAQNDPNLLIGVSGIAPWTFWVAPQLDSHPYVQANPDRQMWVGIAVNQEDPEEDIWCEVVASDRDFTPRVTLLGDGSETAVKEQKVKLLGDLDANAAAGLPHFVRQYWETTPA